MFIRESKTKNKKTNTTYIAHKLVENYRTEKGVRQRVVMSLGTLTLPKSRWCELSALLESRISGQKSFLEDNEDLALIADDVLRHNQFVKKQKEETVNKQKDADLQVVDLNSATTTFFRSLGPELVANNFWNRLEFDDILKSCGFSIKQISLAKAIILGRLIHPESELETWRWFQNATSLIEMTEEDLTGIGKDSFYEIGDLILENKEHIEQKLFLKEQTEFSLKNRVFLYDLTNTYFEGSAKSNEKAKFGRSKEKRTDCPQVTLALVVDELGFPVMSHIYEGGQSEPKTLEDVLKELKKDTSKLLSDKDKPVLIMDRGIATKGNIDLIKENKYPYTVINRRQAEKDYESEFLKIKDYINLKQEELPTGWEPILDTENTVYINKVLLDETAYVLATSIGRTVKEQGMDALKEQRFMEDMEKLKKQLDKGNLKLAVKIAERIGKIKAKYPTVGKFYEIELKISEDNKNITEITWTKKAQREQRSTLTGCYVIETTQVELSGKDIWKQYMQLTRVESAFQDLKSELGLRPIYHTTEKRTEAHLFISVLAYHVLNSIEHVLKINSYNKEWKSIKQILSTHQRCTIILKGTEKKVYHIRTSGMPEPCHNEIYRILKVKDHLKRKKTSELKRL